MPELRKLTLCAETTGNFLSLWSPCLSCRPRGFTQAPHAPCRPSLTQCSSPWLPQAPPSPYLQGSRNCEQGRELREKKAPVTVSPLSPTPASLPPAPTEGEGTTALKKSHFCGPIHLSVHFSLKSQATPTRWSMHPRCSVPTKALRARSSLGAPGAPLCLGGRQGPEVLSLSSIHQVLRDGVCRSSWVVSHIGPQKVSTDFYRSRRAVMDPSSQTHPKKKCALSRL